MTLRGMTLPDELIVSGGIAGEVPDYKAQAIILATFRTLRDKGPSDGMLRAGCSAGNGLRDIEIAESYWNAMLRALIAEIGEEKP